MKIYCAHSKTHSLAGYQYGIGDGEHETQFFKQCTFCGEKWPIECDPPKVAIAYTENNPKEEDL